MVLDPNPPSREPIVVIDDLPSAVGFYYKPDTHEGYLYSRDKMVWPDAFLDDPEELSNLTAIVKVKKKNGVEVKTSSPSRIYLPLVVDTEFNTLPHPDEYPGFYKYMLELLQRIDRGSLPITVQFNTIRDNYSGVGVGTFLHPLYKVAFPLCEPDIPAPRNPLEGYLKQLCQNSSIVEFSDYSDPSLRVLRKTRVLRLDIYAHFAVADFLKMWPAGPVHDHLIESAVKEEPTVDQKPNLKIERSWKAGNGQKRSTRFVGVPAKVILNGVPFALEIGIIDTSNMIGPSNLSNLHTTAGVPLTAKDNYESADKGLMAFHFIAACDRKGISKGAYKGLEKALPGKLNEAVIACDAYPMGNRFLDYAEGDVDLYKAVDSLAGQFQSLYTSLGLRHFYKPPALTIGSTVHGILKSSVVNRFLPEGVNTPDPKNTKRVMKTAFDQSNARELADTTYWAAANARVFGGRVLNTAPSLVSLKNHSLCDMDLAGAYPRSMDVQLLPMGNPVIDLKYSRSSKRNRYENLEAYLKKHEKELVPGCWQFLISCEDDNGLIELPTDQDYFASWETPSIFTEGTFMEGEAGEWLDRSDQVIVFTNQIFNSILNHDGLQWLRNCASREFRTFIMRNCRVKASMIYPACERIKGDDPHDLMKLAEAAEQNGRQNTSVVKYGKNRTQVKTEENEFHGWIGITIADLITNGLTVERDRWKPYTKAYEYLKENGVDCVERLSSLPKEKVEELYKLADVHEGGHDGGMEGMIAASQIGGKHPMDALAKLCANTTYGDLVSKYFVLSNPCVGNNITARVRSMIWYFEKSCRAWNSITDGGLFDLNAVNVPRREKGFKLTEKNTIYSPTLSARDLNRSGIITKPLGYDAKDPILSWGWKDNNVVITRESGEVEIKSVDSARKLIDTLTADHVANSFDHRIDVINPMFFTRNGVQTSLFDFEAKGVIKDMAIHGTANYCLRGGSHGSYDAGKDWTIKFRSYPKSAHPSIFKPFFDQLIDNPEAVDRSLYWDPFVLGKIVKVRKFRSGYVNYQQTFLEPGDTEYNVKVFREFTPSAYRFRTRQQRLDFLRTHDSNRDLGDHRKANRGRARGQSLESHFINPDGSLNYKAMMTETENGIRAGESWIHPELEINQHPKMEEALMMKAKLWKDVVKDGSLYITTAEALGEDFEPLDEDDFFIPEYY